MEDKEMKKREEAADRITKFIGAEWNLQVQVGMALKEQGRYKGFSSVINSEEYQAGIKKLYADFKMAGE